VTKTKEEWAESIKALLENPTDRSIDRLARAVVSAIQQAEHDAFMEGKAMMQQTLDQMRWDLK
jgi:hypothetical protein